MKNILKKAMGRTKFWLIYYSGSSKQRRPQLWDLLKENYCHRRSICVSVLCWYFSLQILNFTNDPNIRSEE